MDKCREAFEKLPVIEEIMGDDYVMFDEQFKKYLCGVGANEEYLNGAWSVWQSRQAEVDQLKGLLEKDEYAHSLYYENLNLQTSIDEKDKRIESIEKQLKRSMIAIEDGEIDWALKNIKKILRGERE